MKLLGAILLWGTPFETGNSSPLYSIYFFDTLPFSLSLTFPTLPVARNLVYPSSSLLIIIFRDIARFQLRQGILKDDKPILHLYSCVIASGPAVLHKHIYSK